MDNTISSSTPLIDRVIQLLDELFISVNEDSIHGIEHARRVLHHAEEGLKSFSFNNSPLSLSFSNSFNINTSLPLPPQRRLNILLASLLHDADDPKVFINNSSSSSSSSSSEDTYRNCYSILRRVEYPEDEIDEVAEMISLVSFSKNGNSKLIKEERWKLIPRDADRLEAIGNIGVFRCLCYGLSQHRPIYTIDTPRYRSREEVMLASQKEDEKRERRDSKDSKKDKEGLVYPHKATLDYFIRGIIQRGVMSSGVKYFEEEAERRIVAIYDILIKYGRQGFLQLKDFEDLTINDPGAREIFNLYQQQIKDFLEGSTV